MTTGDLKNNLRKLVSVLKQIHYPQSEYFASKVYELYGKTDSRFMETVYKVLRDEFGYKPQLTREQFLTIGFAERKIIFLCAILKLLREKHNELKPKGGTSEKKKMKQSCTNSQMNGTKVNGTCKETHAKKDVSTCSDQFGGPLPLDTDMKRFRSNGEALKAGLGLKEPLITREFMEDEPENHSTSKAEDYEVDLNIGKSGEVLGDKGHAFPSNLIIKSSDSSLFGKKFPVSQNVETCPYLLDRSQVKSVTWEDQGTGSRRFHSERREKVSRKPQPNPVSVPVSIHEIPYSVSSPEYYPTSFENTANRGMNPHLVPSPVTMTAAPEPSPDLMLTPTVKSSCFEVIPKSSSPSQVYLHPAAKIPPTTRVVRHPKASKGNTPESSVLNPGSNEENQVCILKQQLQELLKKYDHAILLNNEISARVVLLESKVKLLEEACERKCKCNCRNPSAAVSAKKKAIKQDDASVVVSGFNIHGEPRSTEQSCMNKPTSLSLKTFGEITSAMPKATSRKLFKETVTSLDNDDIVFDSYSHFVEVSDDEDGNDGADNDKDGTGKLKSVLSNEKDADIIISPFPSASKLSTLFSDPSTKNTVVNVQKRLQETRELLNRTNRDFATKFHHYQVE
ncbi:Centrosomal protein of 44 kDa [Stylophora pistillata]|uniref:Centrosomal protein of 44 kDa n=1 Tax=Stylophora pistillata TaxID=50429 RepID=A0A2B4RK66_STYPI|nr:Centrosomal protein of 44 kDa [Stylophora pistillata]